GDRVVGHVADSDVGFRHRRPTRHARQGHVRGEQPPSRTACCFVTTGDASERADRRRYPKRAGVTAQPPNDAPQLPGWMIICPVEIFPEGAAGLAPTGGSARITPAAHHRTMRVFDRAHYLGGRGGDTCTCNGVRGCSRMSPGWGKRHVTPLK